MENKYLKRSMACIQKAKVTRENKLGADHESVADCDFNIGVILQLNNNLPEAKDAIKRAFKIKITTNGECTHLVSKCYEILAIIDVQDGIFKDAFTKATQCFRIRKQIFKDPNNIELHRIKELIIWISQQSGGNYDLNFLGPVDVNFFDKENVKNDPNSMANIDSANPKKDKFRQNQKDQAISNEESARKKISFNYDVNGDLNASQVSFDGKSPDKKFKGILKPTSRKASPDDKSDSIIESPNKHRLEHRRDKFNQLDKENDSEEKPQSILSLSRSKSSRKGDAQDKRAKKLKMMKALGLRPELNRNSDKLSVNTSDVLSSKNSTPGKNPPINKVQESRITKMANFNRKISLNKSEFSSLAESSEPIKTQKSVLNTPPPRKKTDRIDRAARALKSLSKKRDQTNSSFNNSQYASNFSDFSPNKYQDNKYDPLRSPEKNPFESKEDILEKSDLKSPKKVVFGNQQKENSPRSLSSILVYNPTHQSPHQNYDQLIISSQQDSIKTPERSPRVALNQLSPKPSPRNEIIIKTSISDHAKGQEQIKDLEDGSKILDELMNEAKDKISLSEKNSLKDENPYSKEDSPLGDFNNYKPRIGHKVSPGRLKTHSEARRHDNSSKSSPTLDLSPELPKKNNKNILYSEQYNTDKVKHSSFGNQLDNINNKPKKDDQPVYSYNSNPINVNPIKTDKSSSLFYNKDNSNTNATIQEASIEDSSILHNDSERPQKKYSEVPKNQPNPRNPDLKVSTNKDFSKSKANSNIPESPVINYQQKRLFTPSLISYDNTIDASRVPRLELTQVTAKQNTEIGVIIEEEPKKGNFDSRSNGLKKHKERISNPFEHNTEISEIEKVSDYNSKEIFPSRLSSDKSNKQTDNILEGLTITEEKKPEISVEINENKIMKFSPKEDTPIYNISPSTKIDNSKVSPTKFDFDQLSRTSLRSQNSALDDRSRSSRRPKDAIDAKAEKMKKHKAKLDRMKKRADTSAMSNVSNDSPSKLYSSIDKNELNNSKSLLRSDLNNEKIPGNEDKKRRKPRNDRLNKVAALLAKKSKDPTTGSRSRRDPSELYESRNSENADYQSIKSQSVSPQKTRLDHAKIAAELKDIERFVSKPNDNHKKADHYDQQIPQISDAKTSMSNETTRENFGKGKKEPVQEIRLKVDRRYDEINNPEKSDIMSNLNQSNAENQTSQPKTETYDNSTDLNKHFKGNSPNNNEKFPMSSDIVHKNLEVSDKSEQPILSDQSHVKTVLDAKESTEAWDNLGQNKSNLAIEPYSSWNDNSGRYYKSLEKSEKNPDRPLRSKNDLDNQKEDLYRLSSDDNSSAKNLDFISNNNQNNGLAKSSNSEANDPLNIKFEEKNFASVGKTESEIGSNKNLLEPIIETIEEQQESRIIGSDTARNLRDGSLKFEDSLKIKANDSAEENKAQKSQISSKHYDSNKYYDSKNRSNDQIKEEIEFNISNSFNPTVNISKTSSAKQELNLSSDLRSMLTIEEKQGFEGVTNKLDDLIASGEEPTLAYHNVLDEKWFKSQNEDKQLKFMLLNKNKLFPKK